MLSYMGKCAYDSMIRDRFIAAQRNFGLRRYLDGVSSDAPIRDIVDSCRVWESHSDREPSSHAGQDQDSLGESDDSRKLGCLRTDLQELLVCSGMDSRVSVSGVGVSLSYARHRRVDWWMRRLLRRGRWVHYQPCCRGLARKEATRQRSG